MKHLYIIFGLFLSMSLQSQDLENIGSRIKEGDAFKINGAISLSGITSSVNGIDDRISPWSYSGTARLTMSIYDIKIPFYFAYRNHSYHYGSTIPKFRINPRYKWAELQIGDVYSKWNPYVMGQRSIRGAGIRLTPGKFRFKAIVGKLKDLNSFQDTLQLGTVANDSYTRSLVGGSIGFGGRKSYLDIMVVRVKDNRDSLQIDPNIKRQDNVVAGTTLKLKLGKRITFNTNIGLSALTYDRDTWGQGSSKTSEQLTENVIDVNSSTNVSLAGDVSLGYSTSKYGLFLKTRYIQAFYQPLTLAYINTDIHDYTIGGKLSLWKSRLGLNANVGFMKNNVSGQDDFTTHRNIYNLSARFQYNPNLSFTLLSNNFTQNLETQIVNINNFLTYSVNNALHTLIIAYQKSNDQNGWRIGLSGGRNTFTTVTEITENNGTFSGQFVRGDTHYEWKESGWKIGFSIFKNNYSQANNNSNSTYGIQASFEKSLLANKLNLGLKTHANYIDENGYREGKTINGNLIANYAFTKSTAAIVSIMLIDRSSVVYYDYTEWRSRAALRYKF